MNKIAQIEQSLYNDIIVRANEKLAALVKEAEDQPENKRTGYGKAMGVGAGLGMGVGAGALAGGVDIANKGPNLGISDWAGEKLKGFAGSRAQGRGAAAETAALGKGLAPQEAGRLGHNAEQMAHAEFKPMVQKGQAALRNMGALGKAGLIGSGIGLAGAGLYNMMS